MLHMRSRRRPARTFVSLSLSFLLYLCMLPLTGAAPALTRAPAKHKADVQQQSIPIVAPGSAYRQTNFVSSIRSDEIQSGSRSCRWFVREDVESSLTAATSCPGR